MNADSSSMTRARMVFIHFWLYHFSLVGALAVLFGHEFFHGKNPNGVQGISFLIFGGASLFLGIQLINAFTDPLPTWLNYWLTPAHHAPLTDKQKRALFKMYAFTCVLPMSGIIFFYIGLKHGFNLEGIAFPLGIGLLVFLLFMFLLDVFRAIYLFRKDRKTPNPADLNAKSG
jgi:hypothetical protein